jgi:hypothetical protein
MPPIHKVLPCLLLLPLLAGCPSPRLAANAYIQRAKTTCPSEAVATCRRMRPTASYTKDDCQREVRVRCVMIYKCKFHCATQPSMRTEHACIERCRIHQQKWFQRTFQTAIKKACPTATKPCIRRTRATIFEKYEQRARALRHTTRKRTEPTRK